MTNHLHIDPFSGIAGDMFLGALIHAGADLEAIRAALAPLPIDRPYELSAEPATSQGIGAINFHVRQPHDPTHGQHHHHTGYRDIMAMVDQLDVAERARERARVVVTRLGEAEARVHGVSIDDIHFHEVGAVDSIVDMLGSCVALELLGIDSLSCGIIPMSRGWVRCEHGLMPVPAPATAYLLEGVPTQGVDREGEIVTPTGAALCVALCDSFGPQPAMQLGAVGYGAGDKQFPEVPNLLRVMIGRRLAAGDLGALTPADAAATRSTSE